MKDLCRIIVSLRSAFYRQNGRFPDRLLLNRDEYHSMLMSNRDMGNPKEYMEMKVIHCATEIENGVEVR